MLTPQPRPLSFFFSPSLTPLVQVPFSPQPSAANKIKDGGHFSLRKYWVLARPDHPYSAGLTKCSSAVLRDGDVGVFGGASVETKEGESLSAYDSELVYTFRALPLKIMILKKWAPLDKEQVMGVREGEANGKSLFHQVKYWGMGTWQRGRGTVKRC